MTKPASQGPGSRRRGGADCDQSHRAFPHPEGRSSPNRPSSHVLRQELGAAEVGKKTSGASASPTFLWGILADPAESGRTGEEGLRAGKAGAGPPSSASHLRTPGELGAPPLPGARGRRCTSRSPARPPPPPSSLPVPTGPKGRGGEGTGTERDPEPRSLKVKGVEGRSGGLPGRPDPRASPGDRPNPGRGAPGGR